MASTSKPTAVKFRTNIPITMKFPFGDAKEQHSAKFNTTDYFYRVEVNGETMNLYATAKLHELLSDTEGFGKGAVAEIAKVEAEDGGNYKSWQVKIITAGTPVQAKPATGAPATPAGQGTASAPKTGPSQPNTPSQPVTGFSRAADMAGEMWEACLHRARVIMFRNFAEDQIAVEELRSLATTLFIQVGRLGYWQIDEAPGLVALRKLVERIDTDRRYGDIRASFVNLHPLPADPVEQRTLYGQLLEAVKAVDSLSPAEGDDASVDDSGEFPTEEGMPEFTGGPIPEDAGGKAPIGEEAKRGAKGKAKGKATDRVDAGEDDGKDVADPIADGKLVRIRALAKDAFAADEDAKVMFVAEALGIEVKTLAAVPDKQAITLIAALKRHLDTVATA